MSQYMKNGICFPKGFTANGIHCGIRKNKTKKDLSIVVSEVVASAAATYTQNKVKGAPIFVTKEHISDGLAQVILCNSGNANTCNANGIEIANGMSKLCAEALGIKEADVIVASTGVIGEPMSMEPFELHMHELCSDLSEDKGSDACEGIMTTDTFKKEFAISFDLDGKECRIGGMAKGSGMIHPNMATMLAFLTSDVAITPALLQEVVSDVVSDTFNMVSVDGDTSTNDMLCMLSNGMARNAIIQEKNEHYETFKQALYDICVDISRHIAKDGEGATKLLSAYVSEAPDTMCAKIVAKSVVTSSLFKAAMFGKDANWGRILCAIGYADAEFDVALIDVTLASSAGTLPVCVAGSGCGFDENEALKVLEEDEIDILINMHQGEAKTIAWGCDLTYDYVKINGDYRT